MCNFADVIIKLNGKKNMYKTILKAIKEQRGFFKCNISLNRI